MRPPLRRALPPAVLVSLLVLTCPSAADAAGAAAARIRSVYRTVLTADYFGPASGVCSHLSKAGVRSYTAGGRRTCELAFVQQQRSLRTTTKNPDNTGYTPAQWQQVVSDVMAGLEVTIHGKRARATGGRSGIAGATLVRVRGRWLFNGRPPGVGP